MAEGTLNRIHTPETRARRRAKNARNASNKPAPGSDGLRKSCKDHGCKHAKHGFTNKDRK
jgi:hypothetical protein